MMRAAVVAAALVLVACSGSDDDAAPTTPPATASTEADSESTADRDAAGGSTTSIASAAPETTDLRPGVVAFDGSVESLILELPDARNFADGVGEWLDAVPGQEGVLRNSRGITVFVPSDEGFPESAAATRFADTDAAAVTIGEHLLVGAYDDLAELGGSVVVAGGAEYVIADDGDTIGGRRVLRIEAGTNGVVIVIDGPLGDG